MMQREGQSRSSAFVIVVGVIVIACILVLPRPGEIYATRHVATPEAAAPHAAPHPVTVPSAVAVPAVAAPSRLPSKCANPTPLPWHRCGEALCTQTRCTGDIPAPTRYALDSRGYLPLERSVVVEVGSNCCPEFGKATEHPDTSLIVFEPLPKIFPGMVENFKHNKSRLIPFNFATAPGPQKFVAFSESVDPACSSMLEMTKDRDEHGRGKRFEGCLTKTGSVIVPTVSLHEVFKVIDPAVHIKALSIDAQGFDLNVASSLSKKDAERIDFIIIECQDLPLGDKRLITEGASTCSETIMCIEEWFPHTIDFCYFNNAEMRELNCAMKLHWGKTEVPPVVDWLKRHRRTVLFPPRPTFVCPPLTQDE